MVAAQYPSYVFQTVHDIDYEELWRRGVRVLCFDIENTLGLIGCTDFDADIRKLFDELHAFGYRIILATNSLRDFSELAVELKVDVMQPHPGYHWWQRKSPRKPQGDFFYTLLCLADCDMSPNRADMIGDKLIADVSGAQACGMVGVLINPIGPDLDIERFMRLRPREQRLLDQLGISRCT